MAKKKEKKRTKSELVKHLRESGKKLKDARFGLSANDKRLTHRRKTLRKDIARTMTELRGLADGRKIADNTGAAKEKA